MASLAGNTAGIAFQGRDGELRLLDKSQSGAGANGTPWGFFVKFEQMDLTIGFQPRPEELARLDRERFTSDAHTQIGSEEPLFNGYELTFSAAMLSLEGMALAEMVGAKWAGEIGTSTSTWKVKGTPAAGLVSTKGRAITGDGVYGGGRVDTKGSLIVLPGFADPKKVTVDVEGIWGERDGANLQGIRAKEVYFNPGSVQISESAEFVFLRMTGIVYGESQPITAFTPCLNVLTSRVLTASKTN